MKFTVNIPDSRALNSFLHFNSVDYIDVLVDKSSVYFIADSVEIYSHIYFPVITRDGIKDDVNFRISRKKLLNLVIDGFIEFSIVDSMITLNFKDTKNTFIYSLTAPLQNCYTASYINKLSILNDIYEYPRFSIESLYPILRVGRSLNTIVSVVNKVACINNEGALIFQEIDCPNFTLPASTLSFMMRYSSDLYSAQQFLVCTVDNIAVMATKYRDLNIIDYDYIIKSKSSHLIKLNLSRALQLANKCDIKEGTFVVDLERATCEYTQDKMLYKTPVDVKEVKSVNAKKAEKNLEEAISNISLDSDMTLSLDSMGSVHNIPRLVFPALVLQKVLALNLNEDILLYIKKNFLQINVGKLVVSFSRRDYVG